MVSREAIEPLLARPVGSQNSRVPATLLLIVLMRVRAFFLVFVAGAQALGRLDR
jgi:hypothetical protein